jgi:hypothetical protein
MDFHFLRPGLPASIIPFRLQRPPFRIFFLPHAPEGEGVKNVCWAVSGGRAKSLDSTLSRKIVPLPEFWGDHEREIGRISKAYLRGSMEKPPKEFLGSLRGLIG